MFSIGLYKINHGESKQIQQIVINVNHLQGQINYSHETINIIAKKMNKKLYDLTEAIDFMLGDQSEVEKLLSNSHFEESILDL